MLAPPGRARAWLAISGVVEPPPVLRWRRLDGTDASPSEVSPLQPVLAADLWPAGATRTFSGVYEFAAPGAVALFAGAVEIGRIDLRALPVTLPRRDEGGLHGRWFTVLVTSCYDRGQASPAAIRNALARVPANRKPDLGLFLGDQVYLDLPTLSVFPGDAIGLAQHLRTKYEANWFEADARGARGLAELFALAPRGAIPDDHEFWNNYPHAAVAIPKSFFSRWSDRWESAAKQLYAAFQTGSENSRAPLTLDIDPLSFFLGDSRTDRLGDRSQSFHADALSALEKWVKHLETKDFYGVFATGQSLVGDRSTWFKRATAPLAKRIGDFGLEDYADYDAAVRAIVRAARPRRPILCLTGDVHFGRGLVGYRNNLDRRPAMLEIISSPLALVEFVGKDSLKRAFGMAKAWLGAKADPWPRHSAPAEPAPDFGPRRRQLGDPPRLSLDVWHKQRGDHFLLLSFQAGGPVEAPKLALEVSTFAVHDDPDVARSQDWTLKPFWLDDPFDPRGSDAG
jgi:hypothetical protein